MSENEETENWCGRDNLDLQDKVEQNRYDEGDISPTDNVSVHVDDSNRNPWYETKEVCFDHSVFVWTKKGYNRSHGDDIGSDFHFDLKHNSDRSS